MDDVRDRKFDGMIVTGAPVEDISFEEVDYWEETCEIFEWAKTHVTSTLHICWAAQAGFYYYYGIDKKLCYFFENGWEERITKAAEEPFREYLKRNPVKNVERKAASEQEEDPYL